MPDTMAPQRAASIESRASWTAACTTLAILSISYGAPLLVVVGLKPIQEALGTDRSVVALAGALVSGYQVLAQRPAGFGLLQEGAVPRTFAAVPFLVFAAPFIIMRNTLRGTRIERRRFEFVMMATVLAGFWSLMSGTFFVMTLRAAGLLA